MYDKPLISMVIPVYNAYRYLNDSFNCVIKQNYPALEVILVDDGSDDGSAELCDTLAHDHPHVRVIHQENHGLSCARNTGIRHAQGEYICFMDADDTAETDMVTYLYTLVQKYDVPMAICTHRVIFSDTNIRTYGSGNEEVLDSRECLYRLLYHKGIDTSAWAKLYHRDIFREISFPEGKSYEDTGTVYRCIMQAGKIACGYTPKYNYYVRENSMLRRPFDMHRFDLIGMTDQMAEEIIEVYPDLEKAARRRQLFARFEILKQIPEDHIYTDRKKTIIHELKELSKSVIPDRDAPKKERISSIFLRLGYPAYHLLQEVTGW